MNRNYIQTTVYTTFLLFIFSFSILGQKTVSKDSNLIKNEVLTLKHKSDLMKREISYRVIIPQGYKIDKKERFAVLYLLHGLTGNFKNWTDSAKLAEYSSGHNLIIVMPDGRNGWYTNSAVVDIDKYESYIIDELIPKIDKDFRTKSTRENRMIAGLSMGGYGSLKFGLKYPDKFILAGSFSGALGAAELDGKSFVGWKALADSINNTFGDINNKIRKENNVFKILEDKSRDELGKLPFFYLDCGTEDGLIKQNQDFAKLLYEQKVPHEFRQLPGKHDWKFWDTQIQEFLELTKKYTD